MESAYTEADAIAALANKPFIDFLDTGVPVVFTPAGSLVPWAKEIREDLLPEPVRKRGTTVMHDAESFIAMLDRHGSLSTMNIYLDVNYATSDVKAIAVFNDHQDGAGDAGWRDFRCIYQPRFSEEWRRWTANNKVAMDQTKFANFLEDNIGDIVQPEGSTLPSGADVLAFVTALSETRKVKYGSGINLQNGMVQIEFVEEGDNGTKGKLELFKEFAIGIRPYFNGDAYRIIAKLRYRIDRNTGQIALWYELHRHDRALEAASKAIIDKIKSEAGAAVFFGTPE